MAHGMLVNLGQVARRKREDADAMLVEVCSTLRATTGIKKTEGALSRFERGETVPNYLDEVMEAYAEVTGTGATEFWAEALAEWKRAEKLASARGESLGDLPARLRGVSDPQTKRGGRAAKGTPSAGTKRATG